MRAPGFYPDVPEAEYHADRLSLSVSGAKVLLKAPALFRHQLDHPTHSDAFDLGTAAHALALGVGAEIEVVDELDWRTKAAREVRDEIRERGNTPLLAADYKRVQAMADALRSHRLAMTLFAEGQPEVSAYCADDQTGVTRRGRFDWLGPRVVVDYKSAASADPAGFGRAVANFGYHQQAAWYLDLARDLGHPAEAFAFVVQEKTAPYLVSVVELDDAAVQRGRDLNRLALQMFRDCTDSGVWPGYTADDEIARVSLPRWAHYDNELETT